MIATDNPLLGRVARRAAQVRPANGATFEVKENQFIQVSDMLGKQTATMIAFNLHDFTECLSTSQTRSANNTLVLRKGDGVYSNRRSKMFTVIDDTVGRHDMLLPACTARRYVDDYGIEGHGNCADNILRALAEKEYDVPSDAIPDPITLFMHVGIKSRGELEVREPLSGRNDNILFKAHMDTLVVVTACPNDQNAQNAFNPTDILVRVYA